jgi:hypothetical protein
MMVDPDGNNTEVVDHPRYPAFAGQRSQLRLDLGGDRPRACRCRVSSVSF